MANNTIKTFTIQVNTKSGKIAVEGLTKNFVKAEVAFKKLNAEVQNVTTTGLNPLTGATGLAGAAVTELGRTISDVNYGFPAVANNISQLGSLFTILTVKANGAKGAFQLMLKQIRGPLGILLAFQVIITVLEAVSKGFFDVEKNVTNLTNTFSEQVIKLKSYVRILEGSNLSLEKKDKIVKELNETYKDLNIQLDEEGDLTMDSQQNTILYIEALKKKALAQAIVTKIQEHYNKLLEIENRDMSENLSFLDKLIIKGDIYADKKETQSRLEEKASENNEENRQIELNSIDKLINKLEELGLVPEMNTKKKEKSFKAKKDFVAKELSFADDILNSEENVTKKTIHGKEQELKAESQYQIDLAQIKFKEYKRREEARVAAIKDPEDRLKAEKKADEAIKDSQESLSLFMLQKMKETNQLIDIERINDLQKASLRQTDFMNKEAEALLSFNAQMSTNELDRIASERLLSDEQHKNKLDKIKEEIEARKLAGESYIDLEEKQTNEINGYERQKTKFKEKEEKTKLAIANQVGEAIIGIAGEGSAVGKAVAVAMAIMNTKEAITAALGAKPYGPWNIAQAVAVGAFGMKQVQEIMSTKLPVEAAGGGAGAGASMSVSAPDFNVIGQGAGSQLAGVVGSRFGEPIKAYVLSSDVSSAQELDRRIDSTATIG